MVILFMAASPGHSGWSSKGHVTWDAQLISSPMAYSYIHSLETSIFNPGCLGDLLGMKSYPVIYGLEYTIIRIPTKQVVYFFKDFAKKKSPLPGEMIQFDLRKFFQMGWFNHQLQEENVFTPWKIKWLLQMNFHIWGDFFALFSEASLWVSGRLHQTSLLKMIHNPRKLTWQWNIYHLKMHLLLTMGIFQCHVSFQGCVLLVFGWNWLNEDKWITWLALLFFLRK